MDTETENVSVSIILSKMTSAAFTMILQLVFRDPRTHHTDFTYLFEYYAFAKIN